VNQNQENRQNYADDHWDGYNGAGYRPGYGVNPVAVTGAAVAGYAVGASTNQTTTVVTTLPCTPTVVNAGGQNYYQCEGQWYAKIYSGGAVTYVAVQPPPS
jgi:hypothetical protein